ncbi:MAG: PHP domain-containing protein [Oscillatoriales cyanobacterium]|nr:MAG: PHP domain-containing protein [Oscillatoriales cyanobacterium]
MLELHCHTTYSDGTLTPSQLVAAAAASGVRALAITDHDTMSGWDEAFAAASLYNLEIVPGLELSTVHNGRSLHILGFYPDANKLRDPLKARLEGRFRRSQEMVEKLAAMGYAIELPTTSPGMAPGRPHIASALVKAGHAKSSREAFDRWLGDNGPAYVHYEKFSIAEGIDLLKSCGGAVEEVLKELVDAGLMGVEVYHPSHSSSQIHKLKQLCLDRGLLMTGGSDYHGPEVERNERKGVETTHLNMLHIPLELLEPIKVAAASLK